MASPSRPRGASLALLLLAGLGGPAGSPALAGDSPNAADFSPLAVGASHDCLLADDQTVHCRGANQLGQLGDGTLTERSDFSKAFALSGVVRVRVGANHTCAVTSAGTIKCWGSNSKGQLGLGLTPQEAKFTVIPLEIRNLTGIRDVALGDSHSCALNAAGDVLCWGNGFDGQLGLGNQESSTVPRPVPGVSDAVSIAAGDMHTCAALRNGKVLCWGRNVAGQLGNGKQNGIEVSPVEVKGLSGAWLVTAGSSHSCAITTDGALYCWGYNLHGQLGNGFGLEVQLVPNRVVGMHSTAAVQAGQNHTCAIDTDGDTWCWGSNKEGELGIGTNDHYFIPARVKGLRGATRLSVGARRSCAIDSATRVQCWGPGQLSPSPVAFRERVFSANGRTGATVMNSALSSGGDFSCAIAADGTLRCWGKNHFGKLGDGTESNRSDPVASTGLRDVKSIAVGLNSTCALLDNGAVMCWGAGKDGQLGNGSRSEKQTNPTPALISDAVSIWRGHHVFCSANSAGELWCWGDGDHGQSGNGAKADQIAPVRIDGLTDVVEVAGGGKHTCALTAAGAVYCWGSNEHGQLGTGDAPHEALVPQPVPGISNALRIAAGTSHTCALLGDGSIWCWGQNKFGEVGDGTTEQRSTPAQVSGIRAAVAVRALTNTTCAVTDDATAWCWGENGYGEIGDGTTTNRTSPGMVMANALAIEPGMDHTCAIKRDQSVWCWGDGNGGQLGNGAGADSLLPVEVRLGQPVLSAPALEARPAANSRASTEPGATLPAGGSPSDTTPTSGPMPDGEKRYDDEF